MSFCAVPVASQNKYDFVFRKYRAYLYGVVRHSGVPFYRVEDASCEILVRMLAQDGLERFDGDLPASPPRTKAYLATYFSLGARAELTRIRHHDQRSVALDALPDLADDHHPEPPQDTHLLERLLNATTGDARYFIQVAAEHHTYAKTRAALLGEGWDSHRIRRAVRQGRAATRQQLCTPQ